jgi:DNA-directed RNA polymerase delta subunit
MSDTITRQLEVELAALRAQLEELDIVKDIQALERIIRRMKGEAGRSQTASTTERPTASGRQVAATSVVMKDAAERFLRENPGPLQTKDVLDALSAQGIHVPGDSPQNNLSAHLSRDGRFLSLGRDGWVLASTVALDEQTSKEAGEAFAATVDSEKINEISNLLDASEDIPSEVDKALLSHARSELGRNLLEAEKRVLRSSFKNAVHMRALLG